MKKPCLLVVVVIITLSLFLTSPAFAKIVYVKTTGSDLNDGSSWTLAKKTVQAGLNVASGTTNDEVWVESGTYVERITLVTGVKLYGGFVGNETSLAQRPAFPRTSPDPNESVLDGNQGGSVVTLPSGATESTGIDGFTIRNGTGTAVVEHPDPYDPDYTVTRYYGGGIYCCNSSPTITNNIISDSSAESGGGIYCYNSSATISNNTITGNSVATYSLRSGGGVSCNFSSATISNNTITRNSAQYGGGIYCNYSSPAISNNTISDNCATSNGGGIYCYFSSPAISNNILAFSSSGIYKTGGTPVLRNNCVYNSDGYNYSGLSAGTGDISVDPKFADLQYGNLHIQPDSPCIDAGGDSAVLPGWVDLDAQARIYGAHVDIGADESYVTQWSIGPYVIVRVSPNGNNANNGSSWTLAKRTVQAGIDAASKQGGDVWVAAGTYNERITLRSHAYLYGGFTGTESSKDERNWVSNTTILDGSAGGSVVTAKIIGHQARAVIDGFKIQNGSGTLQSDGRYRGGGIYCYYCSPTISNNIITGNSVGSYGSGGGIYCVSCSPTISNNTITDNSVQNYGNGGGIYCSTASPTISNNNITSNRAAGYASGGGGIYCAYSSSPTISNNTITSNRAGSYGGGGIYCDNSSPTISNNIIKSNIGGSYGGGGGIYCNYCSPTISNNIITNNSVGSSCGGGGIYCNYSSATISNNTIAGNSTYEACGGGIYCHLRCSPTLSNNIIAFNTSGIGNNNDGGTVVLRNNDIYSNTSYNYSGLSAGTGDISVDPLFANSSNGNYHLRIVSPCINAGWNDAPGQPETDIDGEDRIQGVTIDIGADECWTCFGPIQDAKLAPDGMPVDLNDSIITNEFSGFFYIESDDRSNGIRVDKAVHGLTSGMRAHVIGSVGMNSDGERYIIADSAVQTGTGTVAPLAINNFALGGGQFGLQQGVSDGYGLNNIGLFIKTWGEVTYSESGFFYLDDGSSLNDGSGHIGVKVYGAVPVGEGENPIGKFVCVTGISSCEKPGADIIRIIRTCGADDVIILND